MKHSGPARSSVSRSQKPPRLVGRARAGLRAAALRAVPAGAGTGDAGEAGDKAGPAPSSKTPAPRPTLSLVALVATTFFVVSGGPYGLEEIVSSHGYGQSLLLLLLVPCIWSLPITMLVGELASTLPHEGGYYAWVRRALGPFWGMQQAWLALAMSLFDMAIYPTLLVTYLSRLWPSLGGTAVGEPGWFLGLVTIGLCALWNIRGSRAVGFGSVFMGLLLLLPFGLLVVSALAHIGDRGATALALLRAPAPGAAAGETSMGLLGAGVLLCMWNYMGWDNASTIAAEVERPQRNYPRAMLLTLILVMVCYTLPVLCAALSGMPPSEWTAGSWVEAGRRLGGPVLAWSIAIGGALCGFGMFNVLVMSYSRLPVAMARDGLLPRWVGRWDDKCDAPKRAILCAAVLYALCLGLGFKRLVEIDVLLYGASVLLQFVALIVLRIREPKLARPFRIPGGVPGAAALSLLPMGLLGAALWNGRAEPGLWGLSALALGAVLIAVGPILYVVQRLLAARGALASIGGDEAEAEHLAALLSAGELPPVGTASLVHAHGRPGHAL